MAVLKRVELGARVTELIRRAGLSEQSFCRRKKYTGLEI